MHDISSASRKIHVMVEGEGQGPSQLINDQRPICHRWTVLLILIVNLM